MACVLVLTVTMLVSGTPAAIAAAAEPSDPPAKEFIVFLGLDVYVSDAGKRRPVVGGTDREVVVRDDARGETVRLKQANVMGEATTKLSRSEVTLENLDASPVHSPARNPMAESQSQQLALMGLDADSRERLDNDMRRAQLGASAAARAGVSPQERQAAEQRVTETSNAMNREYANPMSAETLSSPVDGAGTYDGLEVAFHISARRPAPNTFGVLRLVFRPPQRSELRMQALKLFRIRELTTKPRKIIVRLFGLPPGFAVESYSVHVFAGDRELATNLSANRVDVTVDEAHQFLIRRHASAHPDESRPAEVLAELRSGAPPPALTLQQEGALLELEITAAGRVANLGPNRAIAIDLTPEIEAVVRAVRFLPALVDGKPTSSTGSFSLGELLR